MASEYNSNLISRLYQATEEEEIIIILGDMAEVGDAVFLYPILDGYKKYKNYPFGHYFLTTLKEIKSENTGKCLNDLLGKGEISNDHITWVLDIMSRLEYYTPLTNRLAEECLKNYSSSEFRKSLLLDRWTMEFILEYLKKAGIINEHKENIRSLLFEESLDRGEKATALSYLLRIDPSGEFEYLIENYRSKINKDIALELIVTKELLGWKGKKIEQLKDLIIKNGQERTKEILEKEREDKLQSQAKAKEITQQKDSVIYGNSSIIKDIVDIRRDINRKTEFNQSFSYKLFPDNELLLTQIETANDESSFVDLCVKLRSVVRNIHEKVRNHGLDEMTIKNLLPGVRESDVGKSLNQLFLYLKSKNINVDPNLFGLRLLNGSLSLVGHPEAEKELMGLLSKINALEMYNKKKWSEIHKCFLNFYKQCLDKLNKALT